MAFIAVPCGTKYLLFSKVPDLVAGALHPDDPFRHGFAKVQLENELRQAVFAGKLELTDPTTFAPLGLPASDALVRVDNLMDYFSGRVLFVRGDSENSDSSEIDNSPAGYFSVREVAELIARAHEWTDAMRETLADRLMAAIESGELILRHPHTLLPDHRMTPRDFYGWLSVEDVNTFLDANKAPYRMPATQAEAPAVGASGGDAWKSKAQARALEIIARQRERDLYPSQGDIADEIAAEFRTTGIVGADGKPLAGSSIKRHALKGISSARGKQLSTATPRGK